MKGNAKNRLANLLLVLITAAPVVAVARAPASVSDISSIEVNMSKTAQIERMLNAHSDLLTQLQQQVYDQQRDIQDLRGQLQQTQHQLQQLQQFLQQQPKDASQSTAVTDDSSYSSPASTPDMNTEGNVNNTDQAVSSPDVSLTGKEDVDYNTAVSLALDQKKYDQAINLFEQFIKRYPTSNFQANAHYWLGQLNYTKGKKDDASRYFAHVVKYYPKSSKSPDAMFKVGLIMQENGAVDKAKVIFQQVINVYPASDAAIAAKSRLASLSTKSQ